jgi:hypothetical protein
MSSTNSTTTCLPGYAACGVECIPSNAVCCGETFCQEGQTCDPAQSSACFNASGAPVGTQSFAGSITCPQGLTACGDAHCVAPDATCCAAQGNEALACPAYSTCASGGFACLDPEGFQAPSVVPILGTLANAYIPPPASAKTVVAPNGLNVAITAADICPSGYSRCGLLHCVRDGDVCCAAAGNEAQACGYGEVCGELGSTCLQAPGFDPSCQDVRMSSSPGFTLVVLIATLILWRQVRKM